EVTLYVSAAEIANTDRVHLRFVGQVAHAPQVIELDVDLDTRAPDDAQLAQLRPAFLRGVALFVAARYPDAVEVTLSAPAVAAVAAPVTSPWGVTMTVGGSGSWGAAYQSGNGWGSLGVSRIAARSRRAVTASGSVGATRSPPLVIDGMPISLDTHQYALAASAIDAEVLTRRWSVGARAAVLHQDPDGQFDLSTRGEVAAEWDRFASDDPRGNRLAVAYVVGWQVERYNLRNELGERFARYPVHRVVAGGTVRKDTIGYGLSLSLEAEILHPARRNQLTVEPFLEMQLGPHVDLDLACSLTRRDVPGPADVDQADFAQLSRASYAQPLSMYGSVNLRLHFDRTNAIRNDRLEIIE
ncbi:MAG: hypothetical protein K8W52_12375, partial [Deltaproteobacteria bacterium]|nr:hypothetical protein [Deltaproteobacteria bacterium]